MSVIALTRVVQRYDRQGRAEQPAALRLASLTLERGEVVAVLGANGSGKSTLLETLAFLRRPTAGQVLLAGRDPWAAGAALDARRRCPILLQHTLLFSGTVLENILYGLRLRGVGRQEACGRARAALSQVGLAGFEERGSAELSGGEARRVGLARVLALDPAALLLDEPFSGLDAEGSERLERLLGDLSARGVTVVLSTHGARRVLPLATRIVTLVSGRFFAENLDNQSHGTLAARPGGWTYLDHSRWRIELRDEDLALDPWLGLGPRAGPTRLLVSSQRVHLVQPGAPRDGVLSGELDAVRREGNRARVRLRLPLGQLVRATMPIADAHGLELGKRMELRFEPGSVHLLWEAPWGPGIQAPPSPPHP